MMTENDSKMNTNVESTLRHLHHQRFISLDISKIQGQSGPVNKELNWYGLTDRKSCLNRMFCSSLIHELLASCSTQEGAHLPPGRTHSSVLNTHVTSHFFVSIVFFSSNGLCILCTVPCVHYTNTCSEYAYMNFQKVPEACFHKHVHRRIIVLL